MKGEGRTANSEWRVLFATKSFWPSIGGAEEAARYVAESVSDRFAVTVVTVGRERRGGVRWEEGVRVVRAGLLAYRFSTPLSVSYVSAFRALARRSDLIHMHCPHPLGEVAVGTSLRLPPLVVSYHFDPMSYGVLRRFYKPVLMRALRRAVRVVCSSPAVLSTSPFLARVRDKAVVIPYGVDVNQYRLGPEEAEAARAIRSAHARPLALFVGRLVSYKGVEYLVRALALVDVDLVIIGEGYLKDQLVELVRELNLGDRVTFVPQLPHAMLRVYLNACDFLVLPSVSRAESFGIVLLEAMACGKPVITTEVGTGTSWVNEHGRTGLVVPPQDPEALAQAMATLANDVEAARLFGAAGYRRVVEVFSLEQFVARHVALYLELLRARRSEGEGQRAECKVQRAKWRRGMKGEG